MWIRDSRKAVRSVFRNGAIRAYAMGFALCLLLSGCLFGSGNKQEDVYKRQVQTRRAGMAQAGCCFAGRQADSCVQPRGVPRLGEPEVEAKIKCAVSPLPASQPVDCKAGKGVGEERLFRKGSRLRFFQAKESVRAGP